MAKSGGVLGNLSQTLSSPTGWILAGGTVYVAYLIWLEIQRLLHKADPAVDAAVRAAAAAGNVAGNLLSGPESMIKPIPGPATESRTAVLTGSVVKPESGGTAERGVLAWSLKCIVAINNPGQKKPIEVNVKAIWHGWLWNDVTNTLGVIEVPPGRTLYEFTIPITLVNASGATSRLEVWVDGKNTGGSVEFNVN